MNKENTKIELDSEKLDEMSPQSPALLKAYVLPTREYKVSHNRVPMALVVIYILIIIWCAISWIPFYGY